MIDPVERVAIWIWSNAQHPPTDSWDEALRRWEQCSIMDRRILSTHARYAVEAVTADGSAILPPGHVKAPQSAQEARVMILMAQSYLEHAALLEQLP